MQTKHKGFTLIELLVVIAIIGILAGVISVALNGAIDAGKNVRRKGDIDGLRKALLQYHALRGAYPTETAECDVGDGCAVLLAKLVPEYLPSLPVGPNSGEYYTYISTDGTDFTVRATLSDSTIYSYTGSTGFGN